LISNFRVRSQYQSGLYWNHVLREVIHIFTQEYRPVVYYKVKHLVKWAITSFLCPPLVPLARMDSQGLGCKKDSFRVLRGRPVISDTIYKSMYCWVSRVSIIVAAMPLSIPSTDSSDYGIFVSAISSFLFNLLAEVSNAHAHAN
jgi:hypothetical protein